MRRGIICILLFLSIQGALFCQDGPWYIDKPIRDIIFTGLKHISPNELDGITGPFIGEKFTNSLYTDLQSKILYLNYFDNFISNALPGDDSQSSVIIEFVVKEVPLIKSVKIEGNKKVRTVDILDVTLLKEDVLMKKTTANQDATDIEYLYKTKGFPNVSVSWENRDTNEEKNETVLVFIIDEGKQTSVKSIEFQGNNFVSSSTLKGKMTSKAKSIINSGVFQEMNLELDKQQIQQFYNERGYIDAEVVDITRDIVSDQDSDKIDYRLTYYIEEGRQYKYGGASVEGNIIFSDEEILSKIRLGEGKLLNLPKLNQYFDQIRDIYYNDGYVANNFQFIPERDEENQIIKYKIVVFEKPRSHVENIIVEGNTKTKDKVIFREIPLKVGDIFYKDKLYEAYSNLTNLNYFGSIAINTPIGSSDGLLDLVITVEEGKTMDVNFGLTFEGEPGVFPIIGWLKWYDLNFMGNGQELSIGTNISAATQNLEFSFKENWLFDKRISAGLSFSLQHKLVRNVMQDRLFPLNAGVPDPYEGYYVDKDTGEVWPDALDPEQDAAIIEENNLVTDYQYDQSKNIKIDSDYLMNYDSFDFSLSGVGGYSYHAPLARFGFGTGLKLALSIIDYDNTIFRPYEKEIRDNYHALNFINSAWFSFSIDSRTNIRNPSDGFIIKQVLYNTGGFLFGERDFIRSNTAGEAYIELFNIPVGDSWSYKNVLALRSSLSFILPQFAVLDNGNWGWTEDNRTTTDLLNIDGMSTAKGWPRVGSLESVWDTNLEIRMPILEDYFWLDSFVSATAGWDDYAGIFSMAPQDFKFSAGIGLRSVVPILPIGLFLVKRFEFDDTNKLNFITDEVWPEVLGLKFVISLNQSL